GARGRRRLDGDAGSGGPALCRRGDGPPRGGDGRRARRAVLLARDARDQARLAMTEDVAVAPDRDLDQSRDRSGRVPVALARHGIPGLRAQASGGGGARYGRMFELDQDELDANELEPDVLETLAGAMIEAPGSFDPNPRLPAGYTYFGQFVDHD